MPYIVIYRTATHIAHEIYTSEDDAREDDHMSDRWCGRLFEIEDPEGFTDREAEDIFEHGVESMSPAWGLREVE